MPSNTANASLPAGLVSPPPDLLRAPGVSLHRQIFLVLRDNVMRGTWPAGCALPTEQGLGEQFGVSRVTVRRALFELAAQGLVERRHGLGTFVPENFVAHRTAPSLDHVAGLRETAHASQVRVIEVRQNAVAPDEVAKLLQLGPQSKCVHAVRLRHIGDTPVMLTDAWVPMRVGRNISAAALKKHAMFELLLAQGVEFGRVVQEISAEAANQPQARLLGMELGGPLIKLVRLIHDPQARPVMYLIALMPPERTRILMDIPGEAMNTLAGGKIVHDGVAPQDAGTSMRKKRPNKKD